MPMVTSLNVTTYPNSVMVPGMDIFLAVDPASVMVTGFMDSGCLLMVLGITHPNF